MSKNEDPPLRYIHPEKAMVIWVVFCVLILVASLLFLCFMRVPEEPKVEVSLNRCFLKANLSHNFIKIEPRTTLIERIILCESGNDCTAQNPKSTAFGICQFINGTWSYVQEKWDMELDRDNYYDQYYACKRLLKEESWVHWESSKECWDINNEYK